MESESEEESEDEDEDEEEEEREKEDDTGLVTPAEGLITPSGITSIPAGMETPEIIELRKRKIESEMEGYVCLLTLNVMGEINAATCNQLLSNIYCIPFLLV